MNYQYEMPAQQTDNIQSETQAHLGMASKYAGGKTRDFSLHFFFRIKTEREMETFRARLATLFKLQNKKNRPQNLEELLLELMFPERARKKGDDKPDAGNRGKRRKHPVIGEEDLDKPDPAANFLHWLGILSGADASALRHALNSVAPKPPKAGGAKKKPSGNLATWIRQAPNFVQGLLKVADQYREFGALDDPAEIAQELHAYIKAILSQAPKPYRMSAAMTPDMLGPLVSTILHGLSTALDSPEQLAETLSAFDPAGSDKGRAGAIDVSEAGRHALSGGLPLVVLYEMMRQMAPAMVGGGCIIQSERQLYTQRDPANLEKESPARATLWDPAPINLTFTHSGLTALKLDDKTLASFPDAFRQGMAARAQRLGDTGPSAPENWDGPLGSKDIHGYFTGGFQIGSLKKPVREDMWRGLRDHIDAFNSQNGNVGVILRMLMRVVYGFLGLEVMWIELGQHPYEVDEDGFCRPMPHTLEHFGFRDGISQPFVDMKLKKPSAGGGTPGRQNSWAPVAPGEIFLGAPDEDGLTHRYPANPSLRNGATFLVFRKLQQDVIGFRRFIAERSGDDPFEAERLAARFVGRWKNGTPLVHSPDGPVDLKPKDDRLNNFLFAEDDPSGHKCPLGAHIRRSNPRDIGDSDGVRRHRILRRGISYGGSLLPEHSNGDGRSRGLLFIAANARIDTQFELIQGLWINRGEFLGQAGLGRCPVTGANQGTTSDTFTISGRPTPVTRLPAFVTTKGGDYFFAPSPDALRRLASGDKFPVDKCDLDYGGETMARTRTPDLVDKDRIRDFVLKLVNRKCDTIRVEMPEPARYTVNNGVKVLLEPGEMKEPVVFVGQFADVVDVLKMDRVKKGSQVFSVPHYLEASRRITRGGDLLIATQDALGNGQNRDRMKPVLEAAWTTLDAKVGVASRLKEITSGSIEAALHRVESTGKVDLIRDFATDTVYAVVSKLFGVPGPDWLTELAVSLQFARQHFGQVYPDWLKTLDGKQPANPGLITMQIWCVLVFLDFIGNVKQQDELKRLSLQAGSELLGHLDVLMAEARTKRRPGKIGNLLEAFVANEAKFVGPSKQYGSLEDYYADVRLLLLEVVGSPLGLIPSVFGSVTNTLLGQNVNLARLVPILDKDPLFGPKDGLSGIGHLIYETWRLKPSMPVLMRRCEQDTQLAGSGATVKAGEWITALLPAANLDHTAFEDPLEFSLYPYLPGKLRKPENYLLFGPPGSARKCWGEERAARHILEECMRACGKLVGLRKLAGAEGEMTELLALPVGFNAKFDRVRWN